MLENSDLPREEIARKLRSALFLAVEVWIWRASLVLILAYLFAVASSGAVKTMLHVELNREFATSATVQRSILRAAQGVDGVMIEAGALDLSAAEAERWSHAIERLARRMPVVVVLNGDQSADDTAVFAGAGRVLGQATALYDPGSLGYAAQEGAVQLASAAQSGAGAAMGAAAGGAHSPAQTLLLRHRSQGEWVRRALSSHRPAAQELIAAFQAGRGLSGAQAVAGGLLDGVGMSFDALDWLYEEAGVEPEDQVRINAFAGGG